MSEVIAIADNAIYSTTFCLGYLSEIYLAGENKKISGITIHKDGKEEFIECDGVIFTGLFTPEGTIMQESFDRFNVRNNSAYVTQDYQTDDPRFFVVGNALRGALAAFKCYAEGRDVANNIIKSLIVATGVLWIDPDEDIEVYREEIGR